MITEDYVPFDIAKLLKDKGFNGQYHMYYVEDGKYTCDDLHDIKDYARSVAQFDYLHKTKVPAPTLQMAMKWLREVHQLHIMVNCIGKVNYDPIVQRFDGKDFEVDGVVFGTTKRINDKYVNVRRGFKTYEDACEAAIKYCLENLI